VADRQPRLAVERPQDVSVPQDAQHLVDRIRPRLDGSVVPLDPVDIDRPVRRAVRLQGFLGDLDLLLASPVSRRAVLGAPAVATAVSPNSLRRSLILQPITCRSSWPPIWGLGAAAGIGP
jgi:hypothetical protein